MYGPLSRFPECQFEATSHARRPYNVIIWYKCDLLVQMVHFLAVRILAKAAQTSFPYRSTKRRQGNPNLAHRAMPQNEADLGALSLRGRGVEAEQPRSACRAMRASFSQERMVESHEAALSSSFSSPSPPGSGSSQSWIPQVVEESWSSSLSLSGSSQSWESPEQNHHVSIPSQLSEILDCLSKMLTELTGRYLITCPSKSPLCQHHALSHQQLLMLSP